MKKFIAIGLVFLLASCTSQNDKLINQLEEKVAAYETLALDMVPMGDPRYDSVYNEIDPILNELLASELTKEEMSKATALSLRLQVAIESIQDQQEGIQIDLNQLLQEIESGGN